MIVSFGNPTLTGFSTGLPSTRLVLGLKPLRHHSWSYHLLVYDHDTITHTSKDWIYYIKGMVIPHLGTTVWTSTGWHSSLMNYNSWLKEIRKVKYIHVMLYIKYLVVTTYSKTFISLNIYMKNNLCTILRYSKCWIKNHLHSFS